MAAEPWTVDWKRLVLAWVLAWLTRVLLFFLTFAGGFLSFGEDWPRVTRYLLFVPASVACALVAAAIYPQRALLAALPLLLPPDWALPVGALVAYGFGAASTTRRRGLVALGAVLATAAMCVLVVAPGRLAGERRSADLRIEVEHFLNEVVLAQPAQIVWRKGHFGLGDGALLLRGESADGAFGVDANMQRLPAGSPAPPLHGSQWPRRGQYTAVSINVFFRRSVGLCRPRDLAAAGLLNRSLADWFERSPTPALAGLQDTTPRYGGPRQGYTAVYLISGANSSKPPSAVVMLMPNATGAPMTR